MQSPYEIPAFIVEDVRASDALYLQSARVVQAAWRGRSPRHKQPYTNTCQCTPRVGEVYGTDMCAECQPSWGYGDLLVLSCVA